MGRTKLRRITVDRDSVAMFDDIESHDATIAVAEDLMVLDLLDKAMRACPLPNIEGGEATWIIYIGPEQEMCLGVSAQQWSSPELLMPMDRTVSSIFSDHANEIFFCYWCQANPDKVLKALRYGKKLPGKYSGAFSFF